MALRGIYVGHTGAKSYTPTVLIAGENYSIEHTLPLKEKKMKKVEEELARLKIIVDSQVAGGKSTFIHSQDELTKTLLKISALEQDLRDMNKEMENIKSKALSRAKRQIVVEEMLYPKTVLCLGGEKLEIEEECSGPVRVEIVNDEIKICPKNS